MKSTSIGPFVVLGTLFTCLLAFLILVALKEPERIPRPTPTETVAEQLCEAYGGTKEMGFSSVTEMEHKTQTTKSVYCKDGSYVSRTVEMRK